MDESYRSDLYNLLREMELRNNGIARAIVHLFDISSEDHYDKLCNDLKEVAKQINNAH